MFNLIKYIFMIILIPVSVSGSCDLRIGGESREADRNLEHSKVEVTNSLNVLIHKKICQLYIT